MRYQIVIVGPAVPDTEMVASTAAMSDVTIIARTDDLELAYLILDWAGEKRRMPHERLGVWDCTAHDWRVPDQVLRGG
jgi:hypothetical protein